MMDELWIPAALSQQNAERGPVAMTVLSLASPAAVHLTVSDTQYIERARDAH